MDNNDVPTDIYEFDTDCDCYNDHNNNNINIITGDYDNYDEDNSNNVDRYDVGIAQDDDLVANDCEENNYSTSLVPCVLSSSGTASIADGCDPVGANDHYMIRCYNTSPTISGMSSLTSFTFPLNLSSLETSSSSNRDTCVGCNSQNGDDTDLDLVPVQISSITSIHLLLVQSSLETTSLSSNLSHLSSDCGLVRIGYIAVAPVASLATNSSLSSSLLSSTFSSISVLDYSFVSCWLSSNAYVLNTIGSSSNSSDVSTFVNLHQLYLVLLLKCSYFLGWFASSPISLFPLAIKIYCDFNPISLGLMIIIMIMGLCWFLIMAQITSHKLGLNPRLNPITSSKIQNILPQYRRIDEMHLKCIPRS
mmetsp:Transcript_42864/g.43599  ORF Transcript_42864/g.43599 Transcript_42864/m.43599 type:complete len:363 (+) Transcript_42864:1275-2363(+)